jgi:hypothetical protein
MTKLIFAFSRTRLKIKSHAYKMHSYFSVHFNDISENIKLKLALNHRIKMVHTMLVEKHFLKNNI